MAQKVTDSLIDDLSGSQADETVSFGLDGKTYEIGRIPTEVVEAYHQEN